MILNGDWEEELYVRAKKNTVGTQEKRTRACAWMVFFK